MKEYNVLEASGLCMNGNPVDWEISQAHMYGMKCDIQNTIRSYDQKLFDGDGIGDHKPKGILNIAEPFVTDRPLTEATKAINEAERKLEKDEYGLYIHARGYTETRDRMDKFFKK
ncbi:hypothetical protein KAR91_70770 [Candidatus Pacearchaeota archaeon]|nr:hypothetical protein [Candidatus Pacearchaeota archaeon]